jgi:DNA-binding transcriptional LysR family regulator
MDLSRLDLNKLHSFFVVAEEGGVSAAARRLALTPSAISQALSGLESSLEVPLFHRVGRGLVLTREGELLHRRLRDYQHQLAETLDEVVNEDREVRGLVRVGLYLGFPREPLAGFLARFCRAHPRVSVRILYEGRDDLNRALLEGRVDLALAFDPQSPGRMRTTRLFKEELVLVAGRAPARRRFRFEDLEGLPIVDYYQVEPLIHRWVRHHFRRKPPRLQVVVWAASANLVLELVLRRTGAGVLPRHVALSHLERGRLVQLETGRPELADSIWLKELPSRHRSPVVEAFREAALEAFGVRGPGSGS